MRIATWNINSLRLRLPMLSKVVKALRPDMVCLQETKVEDGLFPLNDIQELGFKHVLFRGMKSYNGVAILSRVPLIEMKNQVEFLEKLLWKAFSFLHWNHLFGWRCVTSVQSEC